MDNQEEYTTKELLRKESLKAEEIKMLARDKERTKAYLAREQKIEMGQKIKENQRINDLANEEKREMAKDIARKETYLAREKALAEELAVRKAKKQF